MEKLEKIRLKDCSRKYSENEGAVGETTDRLNGRDFVPNKMVLV